MEFFENKQNSRKNSKGTAGEGDSNAVPFPSPLLLLGDARTLLRKRKLCPKKLCQLRGSPHATLSNLGPFGSNCGQIAFSNFSIAARCDAGTT